MKKAIVHYVAPFAEEESQQRFLADEINMMPSGHLLLTTRKHGDDADTIVATFHAAMWTRAYFELEATEEQSPQGVDVN